MEKKIQKTQIDFDKKSISFVLNLDFYTLEEIKETLEEFRGVCDGEIKEISEKKVEVTLFSKDFNILNILKYEFCNYLLGIMKNNLRV